MAQGYLAALQYVASTLRCSHALQDHLPLRFQQDYRVWRWHARHYWYLRTAIKPPYYERFYGSLCSVIINTEPAIIEVTPEFLKLVYRIGNCFP